MTADSYPSAGRDTGSGEGVLSDVEYETLVGDFYPTGILGLPTDLYPVYTDGTGTRAVKFRAGAGGMVHGGRIFHGDTDIVINAAANAGGSTRYDLAVWRLDRSGDATTIRPAVVTGGSSPVGPAPTQDPYTDTDGTWEYPLLVVPVDPGDTVIPASENTAARKVGYWIAPPLYLVNSGSGAPPPSKGQTVIEYDTNVVKHGDGAKFLVNNQTKGVQPFIAKPGWSVATGTVEKVDGTGYVNSLRIDRTGAAVGAHAANVVVATIPAAFAPRGTARILAYSSSGPVFFYLDSAGNLTMVINDGSLTTNAQIYAADVTYRCNQTL